MGLKFRRGTTAQKSGSLAFGEPYVNTDLGTLQIGGATGDITLGASGTGSAGQFSSISGSSIEVSGNATVGGNLTVGGQLQIGDQTSDTVNVVASLSSSLIPQTTNAFDLGSATKIWRDLYISTGSIKFVEGTTVVKTLSAATLTALEVSTGSYATTGSNTFEGLQHINEAIEIHSGSNPELRLINDTSGIEYHIQNSDLGHFQIHNGTTNRLLFRFQSASVADGSQDAWFYAAMHVSESITANGGLSGSIAATNGVVSGSSQLPTLATTGSNLFRGDQIVSGSFELASTASVFRIEGNIFSQTYLTSNGALVLNPGYGGVQMVGDNRRFQATDIYAEGTLSASVITGIGNVTDYSSSVNSRLGSLNTYTSSLNAAIQLTGSTVSFLGNIVVYGTQSIVNSTNVELADNILYLAPTASIDNDLGIVGHYNDGTYRHAGIFMDASDGHSWKVFNGLQGETNATIDTAGTGFTLADFKAGAFTGNSFNGTINATNSVVSGSSQIISILSSLNTTTASLETRMSALATLTGSNAVKLTNLESTTASLNISVTNLNTATSSYETKGRSIVSGSAQIDGSLLGANKTITVGSTSITLGGTATTIAGLTSVTSTGFTGALTGNASTATTLQTARAINGVNFDGSAAITVTAAAGTLSGATLASGVTASSLTSVGTLTSLTVTGTITANGGVAVTGALTATGDITAYYSDGRLKENLQVIPNALEKVSKLTGYTYNTNALGKQLLNNENDNDIKVGVIAQDLQEVLPQAVKFAPFDRDAEGNSKSGENYLTVQYEKIVPLLIQAIKEQQTQIHSLTLEIEKLKEPKGL